MNRRTVLTGVATGALAGLGLVGTASGHWVRGTPVFCGCDQLCVCVAGNADVLMAQETDDGGYDVGFVVDGGRLDPAPTGTPHYSGDFCVSTADDNVPDGKIIGLQVAGTRWVNPDQCAQDALDAEQRQLDSTHLRPAGNLASDCETPPCVDSEIEATWEDCETVSLSGPDENLEEIVVYLMRCFDDPGLGCPDGAQATIDDPELPLTLGRDRLAVGDEPYHIDAVEFVGGVHPDHITPPDDFDCGFDQDDTDAIEVIWTDCETVSLSGPDENLEEIVVYLMRCFDDPGLGCPDVAQATIDDPELPLTLGRDRLALGDEPYHIVALDFIGTVQPDDATPPDDFDCHFE
ncbi:hypothetical protein [Halococcoides cellulosivorans]|uniref:hypothetical protein n=1 Tax=Halococcoides cellulosivorans TaxID=1679096 RepID=UPI00131EDC7B|nr:hypothetical protein [Halococcoides cellulosivorans]